MLSASILKSIFEFRTWITSEQGPKEESSQRQVPYQMSGPSLDPAKCKSPQLLLADETNSFFVENGILITSLDIKKNNLHR